jgi:hypothetical protein
MTTEESPARQALLPNHNSELQDRTWLNQVIGRGEDDESDDDESEGSRRKRLEIESLSR